MTSTIKGMKKRDLYYPQYATDVMAEVVGKPSSTFFQAVLQDAGVRAYEVKT